MGFSVFNGKELFMFQRMICVVSIAFLFTMTSISDVATGSSLDIVRKVQTYNAVWDAPPQRTPANHSVDGPLLGNGDMGVCFGGSPESFRFYLSKNDFWRLKSEYGKSGPRVFGYLDVAIDALKGADYRVEQRVFDGATIAVLTKGDLAVQVRSKVVATENLLVVELSAQGGKTQAMIQLTPASGNDSDSHEGCDGDLFWAARKFVKEVDIATEVAAAMKIIGAQERVFMLSPDRPVTLLVAMASRFKHDDPLGCVKNRISKLNQMTLPQLHQEHNQWWEQYWNQSYVDIGDPILEKAYYQSLYSMGAASRDPEFPPAIFGTWITTDNPNWLGDYHLNYNHMAPFYALYSANRVQQGDPQDAPLLDFIERGRWYAENITQTRGVLYPVGIGPLGVETTRNATKYANGPNFEKGGLLFQQRSNSAYCLVNIAQRWRTTYDPVYGKKVYSFVKETAEFWEDYLVFENDRYNISGDAIHEGSGQNTNPILSLGLVYNTFDLAYDISQELGVDASQCEKWKHILDHLSGYSTQEKNDKTVFRYTEKGTAWWGGNTLGIQQIYPGNTIGLDSDPKLVKVSHNTIDVMQRWLDSNGTNSFFPAAVRVGYDPAVILEKLRAYAQHTYPNGFQASNPHGIENFSTVPNTINMMLCMSHVPVGNAYLLGTTRSKTQQRCESVIRLFSVWPTEMNACFEKIRCWGAFLVSSELKDKKVQYVKLYSERGRDCTMVNPWPSREVIIWKNGRKRKTLKGDRFTFKTHEDGTLILGPKGVSLEELQRRMARRIPPQPSESGKM
jgi:hypothetical protein